MKLVYDNQSIFRIHGNAKLEMKTFKQYFESLPKDEFITVSLNDYEAVKRALDDGYKFHAFSGVNSNGDCLANYSRKAKVDEAKEAEEANRLLDEYNEYAAKKHQERTEIKLKIKELNSEIEEIKNKRSSLMKKIIMESPYADEYLELYKLLEEKDTESNNLKKEYKDSR